MANEEAREAAVRAFRHELEDNGGFTAGETAMLVETFDRAYGEGNDAGIRQAREAARLDLINDDDFLGRLASVAGIPTWASVNDYVGSDGKLHDVDAFHAADAEARAQALGELRAELLAEFAPAIDALGEDDRA